MKEQCQSEEPSNTPPPSLDAVAGRINQFLEQALAGRDPARDIPESEAICAEVLTLLDAAANWDEESQAQTRWDTALRQLAMAVASYWGPRSADWPRVADLISIYLRAALVAAHPLAEPQISIRQADGINLRTVQLPFLKVFLEGVFRGASSNERGAFYETVRQWDVWRALAEVLNEADLTVREFVRALKAGRAFSRGDMMASDLLEPFYGRLAREPALGMQVVDAWVRRDEGFEDLPPELVPPMVEAVVASHTSAPDVDVVAWRESLLAELGRKNSEESWRIAALVACFAWPSGTPVDVRHSALLEQVARLPHRLTGAGLQAALRDARQHPKESVQTAVRLLERSGTAGTEVHAAAVAQIVEKVLDAGEAATVAVVPLESTVLAVPPGRTALDAILAKVARKDEPFARQLLFQWLQGVGSKLRHAPGALGDFFPQLAHELGVTREADWLVALAVSPSLVARVIGIKFFAYRDKALSLRNAVLGLSDNEARALVHMLVGSSHPGSKWIPALFDIALARPDIAPEVGEVLIEEVAADYPGTCRKILDRVVGESHAEPIREFLQRLEVELTARLSVLQTQHAMKVAVPEIVTTRPAAAAWDRLQGRLMSVAMREGERKSLFRQLATRIPMARGDRTLMMPEQSEPTKVETFSFSSELPVTDSYDPIAARLRRAAHYQEADQLLAAAAKEHASAGPSGTE